ncbi:MAG: GxxExxY protein [Chitinophagales bacterium]|nr:GxxExxY protein [Chitinophagales bacterium]
MNTELKYKDITEKIIGASFEVHKFLGNGFQEVIYQRALAYEMRKAGLEFAREIEQDIFYKDLEKPIGTRRADFVVDGKVLVELKAIIQLEDVHLAQALNYLKASKSVIQTIIAEILNPIYF